MPDNCRHWQGLLAEYVLASRRRVVGAAPAMGDALAEHLGGCHDCQQAAVEFRSVADALAHTTAPTAVHLVNPTSAGMSSRITARVEAARRRRDRRRRLTAVAAVAAAIAIVVSVMVVRHHDSTEVAGERVALSAEGMQGDATLQSRSWGTQIELAVAGFIPGQHYSVWLEKADGSRVGAGTFIGVRNARITIALSSALPASEAVAIGISKTEGDVVVRAGLD